MHTGHFHKNGILNSSVQKCGRVAFPEFTGERVYMREFTKAAGLPADLSRWQPTVDAMLDSVDSSGSIFLMVDQAKVLAGASHRRGGIHIDGAWLPELQCHGGGGGTGWRHGVDGPSDTLILASDVFGCRGYAGAVDVSIGGGGDCSHIDLSGLDEIDFEPGFAYRGDALSMLHESIALLRDSFRTVVRLNVRN